MTGMVKEAILTRQAELVLLFEEGKIMFDRVLVDPKEFLAVPSVFTYLDIHGREQQIELEAGSLAYTICQTPVLLKTIGTASITIHYSDGTLQRILGSTLDAENSRHIFLRDGFIHRLTVDIPV